jgi:hypothetical protein
MVTVAIQEPVLEAASREQLVCADGGVTLEEFATKDTDKDTCCEAHGFPCFDCYNDGRRDLLDDGE